MNLIADALARIQNAIKIKQENTTLLKSGVVEALVGVLKREHFINGYEITDEGLVVSLKYVAGEPVITTLQMISKPGQRIYVKSYEIKPVINGRGICIISTSEGLMSGAVAKSKNLGGELICNVW